MMRALRSIVCGLLSALIVGGAALAVTSGGFPSRPRFQAVAINTTIGATNLSVTGNSGANTAFFQGSGAAGSNFGVVIAAGASSGDYALRVENGAQTAVSFQIDGAGDITAPNAASVPWTQAFTAIIGNSGTCTVLTEKPAGWITGCTHTGNGHETLTFTGLPTQPACSVNINSSGYGVAHTANTSSAGAEVLTYSSQTPTLTDFNFQITCIPS